MAIKRGAGALQTMAGLLLLLFFCGLCALSVVLGAQIYAKISGSLERQYSVRTCLSYVSARVRSFDCAHALYLTDFGQTRALALEEQLEDQTYVTYIYGYEGSVYELFALKGSGLEPADGLEIIKGATPQFSFAGEGLLYVRAVPRDGGGAGVYLSLQSVGGGLW